MKSNVSFALTLCEDHIDDCVKPHLAEKYRAEIKSKWFAAECDKNPTCNDCKRSQKKPGLLKIEAKITSGWLLATSPKCYLMTTSNADRMDEMEKKIIEFGNLDNNNNEELRENNAVDRESVRRLLGDIERLELEQGDATPYKIAKKSAKGCNTKIKLRFFLCSFFGRYIYFQFVRLFMDCFWWSRRFKTALEKNTALNSNGPQAGQNEDNFTK